MNRSMNKRSFRGFGGILLVLLVLSGGCSKPAPVISAPQPTTPQPLPPWDLPPDSPPPAIAPFDANQAKEHQEVWAKHLGVEVEIENSIGMKLVLIPPGEFIMGRQETAEELARAFEMYGRPAADSFQDEYPRHRVRITKPFYLGVYEVTVGQFGKFVSDSGYRTDAERNTDVEGALGYNATTEEFELSKGYSWRQLGFPQGNGHPVVNVSHNDALAFCVWLSRTEGQAYRLPTEAEWEYACRAGTTTRYDHGDDPEGLSEVGNVADGTAKSKFSFWPTITGRDGYVFTAPVGTFEANGFGLFDMHGNVWEWCLDWYGGDTYAKSSTDDPTGPERGSGRVFRGGGWSSIAWFCRSAHRTGLTPSLRIDDMGFRLVRSSVE